ncbi:GNAT family N-acetyltransferase [Sphingobacterium populi]|uniref:GNAT family N-acetyltransferase n=1 Tax=Sphingobacterium populi TaxID=1812824 RepID=A0ABW5UHS5_9SPHI
MIRQIKEVDYPRLMEIWEASVRATHKFLSEIDFQYYKIRLPTYFEHVSLFGYEKDNILIGFAGVALHNLEMLFIDATFRGIGVGKTLLTYAVENFGVTNVDVNEQNVQAVDFYKHMGFQTYMRTEVDDHGKHYPILKMQLGTC